MTDNTNQNKLILNNDEGIKRYFIYTREILDDEGNIVFESKKTGEYIEMDLEDIEAPLRYQELVEEEKKLKRNYNNQKLIISKKQDHKGKKMFSSNEEALIRLNETTLKDMKKIYDMFLGEGAVDKLLYGRKLRWTTFQEIDTLIEKYILPDLKISMDEINKKITNKYTEKKEENILE